MTRQFRHFDADGDGRIEFDEFKSLLTRLGLRRTDAVMRRLFQSIDHDDSGFINLKEFSVWWTATGGEVPSDHRSMAERDL